jgi:hypothetical protein
MKNFTQLHKFCPIIFTFISLNCYASNIGGVAGSITSTINAGSATSPQYAVVSAGISSDAVYTGQVSSVTTSTVSFETSSDTSEATISPFVSGVFNSSVKTPILTSSLSGAGVGSISITYAGSGFTTVPEIIIDYPTSGDDQATATVSITSGAISGVTITNAGSGYDAAPNISIVGGPHFIKLTESGDDDEGRYFLITDNNSTRLTLDTSTLLGGESLSDILQEDYSVEVYPAPTLASMFGAEVSAGTLSSGITAGNSNNSDYIYFWDSGSSSYPAYHFLNPGFGPFAAGWIAAGAFGLGSQNDKIIFPDEAFIIANRTSGNLELDFDGTVSSNDNKLYLPVSGDQVIMNNPYGADMLLGELIPSEYIGSGNNKFKTGSSQTDANSDKIYFLEGAEWKLFYHKTGVNDSITKAATATARAGTFSGTGIADADISLASGTVSVLQSCTASGGLSVDHNDSNHTRVTLSGTPPLVGFDITFSGIIGRKLNDNGDKELDFNGTEVSNGSGIKVISGLNGTYKVVSRTATTVVVRKRRDINFIASGPRSWTTGQGGTGYTSNAKAYFVGGGNTSMAVATATVSSGSVTGFNFSGTGDTRGAGYQYAPQVIISSGGWRKIDASNAIKDGEVLGASTGLIVLRNHPTGVLSYLKTKNPFK